MQSYIFSHINTLPDADYSRFFCKIVSRNSTFIYVMQDKIDTYTHVVGPFDTDCSHRLSWNVLGTRILSAATSHARRRGFDTFEKDGVPYLWVLSRMVIEIDRWPMVNETYQLTTWIKNYYRYFTDRYFYLHDGEGNIIGHVLTIWAMIDSETRMPAELRELFGNGLDRYVCPDDTELKRSRIRVNRPDIQTTRHTFYSDLDTNNHVNSIKYIEFLLDALPPTLPISKAVRRIEMEYCAESYVDDTLSINIEETDPLHYNAEITKLLNGKTVTVCRSSFMF